jgi:hypothetical protein
MKLKTFRSYINESPYPNTDVDMQDIKHARKSAENYIKNNHDKSTKLSDTDKGSIHKLNDRENTYYYHYVNGSPREFSEFDDDHNQLYTDKNGGDSKYNKEFLYHHANKHNIAKSDVHQSKGGEKLWKDIINSTKPGFSVYHQGVKITPENLKTKQSQIWNNKIEDEDDNRIELKKE